ncbi:MBL fold metallo-hydrolase [Patescibacteria group bacterium]|nr:MAG: MBL fold metallo-hydrolase [Patescibacteria group bacterium]
MARVNLFLKKPWLVAVAVLLASNIFIWYAVFYEDHGGLLTVAFLDIGQGDAIFIEAPNGNQLIMDGGPDRSLLRELSKVLPFYDHSIDMLVVTNPDTDHFAGFIDVLKNYEVEKVIEPGTKATSETYRAFEKGVALEQAEKTIARRGMKIILDKQVYLEVLFPDQDVSQFSTNDGSIISRLVYGDVSYMLTGDTTQKMERHVLALGDRALASTVLKVAHHGSRTSSGEDFVKAVDPKFVVISAGRNNKYGHPHKETLDTFSKLQTPVLGTYERGMIITRTDGKGIEVE